jgi:hypothetical protein
LMIRERPSHARLDLSVGHAVEYWISQHRT